MPLLFLTSLWQWGFDPFFDWFFFIFNIGFIFTIVFAGVIIAIIIYVICRATRASRNIQSTYGISGAPVAPVRRVVRETLPTKCPACLGPISYEKVDWVGPRQAKCPYCGNVMELQVQETTESQ